VSRGASRGCDVDVHRRDGDARLTGRAHEWSRRVACGLRPSQPRVTHQHRLCVQDLQAPALRSGQPLVGPRKQPRPFRVVVRGCIRHANQTSASRLESRVLPTVA
jgi:hypothetical protein